MNSSGNIHPSLVATLRLILSSLSCLFFILSVSAQAETWTVIDDINALKFEQCQKDLKTGIFGPHHSEFNSWNHTDKHDEFASLGLDLSHYQIQKNESSDGCSNPVLSGVLVKKFADWNRQHANGFELINPSDFAFKDLKRVILIIKIDKARSSIPSQAEVISHFAGHSDAKTLSKLDKGNINLSIGLYANSENDGRSYNAEKVLAISPLIGFDKWMKVSIPLNELSLYSEENYASTEIPLAGFEQRVIEGVRITAETEDKKVLRNLNGELFRDGKAPPELFKEIGVSLLGFYFE